MYAEFVFYIMSFMLNTEIVFESEGYCDSTLEFLVDRLNKQSCHVKFKVSTQTEQTMFCYW